MLTIGLLLGCGPAPTEVVAVFDGTTDASTSTASTGMASTPGSTSAEGATASGSGGATGQGTTASGEGDTTQGLQDGTSTGEVASTGASGPGSSSGGGESSSSTGAPPSCQELYGAAPGYELCMETPEECHFAALTNGGDCNAMCGLFGGTCIDAFDNSTGCNIIRPDMDTCETDRGSEICVCSR